jgi:hypothetical protein
MIYHLPSIQNNKSGYEALATLAQEAKPLIGDELELDFSRCGFFAANMAAPLGAVLNAIESDFNTVGIVNVPDFIEIILRKNDFLKNYGYEPLEDSNQTTIPYRRIQLADSTRFEGFIKKHLRGKGIPSMTEGFGAVFKRKLYEVFENAVIHSRSGIGVCVCGQFFPNKQKLDISIADAGIGIRQNVRRHLNNPRLSSVAAINWAVEEGHSTKTGPHPGGLGLKFLKDFTLKNRGCIQIVSRMGFYEFANGVESCTKMPADLPGTVINIEINTGDSATYELAEEISPDDIF